MSSESEIKLLTDLIEKTEKSADAKFSSLNESLKTHIEDNHHQFDEIKDLLIKQHNENKNRDNEFYNKTIKPIIKKVDEHEKKIIILEENKKNYIKKEICQVNEEKLKESFSSLTKKIILYNLTFLVIYVLILYNSNIIIKWGVIASVLAFLKKLF